MRWLFVSLVVAVVYTAMHGVGTPFARQAFEAFHLPPFVPVAAQVEADPNFPTVEFPNPEVRQAVAWYMEVVHVFCELRVGVTGCGGGGGEGWRVAVGWLP